MTGLMRVGNGALGRFTFCFLAGNLAWACASAPPKPAASAPAPEDAAAYYPLSTGWKWAYDLEKDGDKILAIYTVLENGADGAVILAGEEHINYALTPEGVARRENGRPTDFVLKNPVRMGAEWVVSDGKAKIIAAGAAVTVAAGTFQNCVTVEETRVNPPRIVRTTFAAGIGPVTLEYQLQDPATGQFQIAMRASLRGVTKPGEDPLGAKK